jgi:hypothetical protein
MDNIKVKNSELNEDTLGVLNSLIELDINAVSAFKLSRILKTLGSIVEDKMKTETKIQSKWIMRDSDGNPVPALDSEGNPMDSVFQVSDIEGFTKDMSDFMNYENILQHEKIEFEELGLKTAKVRDLIKVEFLFK